MSWEPGDLALCVRGGPIVIGGLSKYPKAGRLYRVNWAGPHEFVTGVHPALWLDGAPLNSTGRPVWAAHRFRKITPGADIEGVEVERRIKQPVSA